MSGRYLRHTVLPEIGIERQASLSGKKVAIVGCGGLGGPVSVYLAGAGVGQLTLIDGDSPDLTNLHRQVYFKSEDVGSNKAETLKRFIKGLSPESRVTAHDQHLTKENVTLLKDHDLVLDCVDRLEIKYLINDYCHLNHLPLVYAAVYKFEGYLTMFRNDGVTGLQLRDIFPSSDAAVPNCESVGVLNTAVGMIGLMQANEALKYLLGIGHALEGQLLWYDALENEQFKVKIRKAFKGDMNQIWTRNSYTDAERCPADLEIALDMAREMDDVLFVSLLENWEKDEKFDDRLNLPFSEFKASDPALKTSRPLVFYCQSGIRSAVALNRFNMAFPDRKAYSLKGGLLALVQG